MNKNTLFILLAVFSFSFFLTSCEKIVNAGPGYETFYVSAANAVFPVTVSITSLGNPVETGTVSTLQSTAPDCLNHSSGVAYSFSSTNSATTSYGFTAVDNGGHSWTGTFTMYYGYCHLYELHQ